MNIIQSLLNLPTFLSMLLLILFFAGLNVFVTVFTRWFQARKIQDKTSNEITGYIFSVVAGFYALLLSFVVFQALDKYNNVQKDADTEASSAKSFYRQVKHYPDTAKTYGLKMEFLNYVKLVVREEYPAMAKWEKSELAHNSFEKVFEMTAKLNQTADSIKPATSLMVQNLIDLSKFRSLRQLAGDVEISQRMWEVLLIGGLIIAILASLINVKSRRYHLFLNGLMGAFIGLIIFLIITLDHPFAGSVKIKPDGYSLILNMEEAGSLNK
jgi:Ca2+/H+ antiporter